MKTLWMMLFGLLYTLYAQAQGNHPLPFDETTQRYRYSQVVEMPDKDAASIYTAARLWCREKNVDEHFQIDEPNTRLTDIGSFAVNTKLRTVLTSMPVTYVIRYNIHFYVKDNRCKIEVSHLDLLDSGYGTAQSLPLEVFEKQLQDMPYAYGRCMRRMLHELFLQIDQQVQQIMGDAARALQTPSARADW